MILVIDITKGVQAQTKECLVIGEVINTHLLVVLNKVDQLPEKNRDEKIKKMTKLVKEKVLSRIQVKKFFSKKYFYQSFSSKQQKSSPAPPFLAKLKKSLIFSKISSIFQNEKHSWKSPS